jgi:hypothetical protein
MSAITASLRAFAASREIDSLLRADSLLNDNSQSSSKSCPILRSSCQRLKNIWVLLDQGTYEQIEEHVDEKMDYSEAAYVDSQYEYLQKHKSEGITLEELRRRRAVQR